jgi:hypothetical protein
MVAPVLEIRVDWRNTDFNYITNPEFEVDTSGWSVAASIQSAATSITRSTVAPYMGLAAGRLVTTSTNGSGVKYVITGTFTSGRTYRFKVYLKSISGTTSAKILIGSLGTVGDRASATMTLTTGWVAYSVDWTPSGNRTDVQVNVTNNAASIMTADIDVAEVYETLDDITSYAEYLTYTRGANFDGTREAPGSCTVRLLNIDGRFSPDNASSPLSGLLVLGRRIWIRATHGGATYALFYGSIRRIVPTPGNKLVEIVAEDPLYYLSRSEVSVALSTERSIYTFRQQILTQLDVAYGLNHGIEDDIVYTEADQANVLDLLSELNVATGTVHYIRPHASSQIRGFYFTIDRVTIQGQAVDETFNDDLNDLANYDLTDEGLVNSQRVFPTARRVAEVPEVVWEGNVPFTIDVPTATIWAGRNRRAPGAAPVRSTTDISFEDPTFEQALTIEGTGISGSVFTPFSRSAKIEISTATDATIDVLFITGKPARRLSDVSVQAVDTSVVAEAFAGGDISSEFITSEAMAKGLADWWVYRYKGGVSRPDVTYVNKFPTQLARDITDRVSLNFALLGISAKQFLIRSLTTRIDLEAKWWETTYNLESTPSALNLFTIGGTADQGIGGTAVLGH